MPRNKLLILMLLVIPAGAAAKNKDNGRPPCATTYSVIQEDKLGNVQQGISKSKDLKWADKDLEKKYPDVCYAAPDPSVKTVFVITVAPATYNGTKVVTNTDTTPTSGTVTDTDGNTATYQGTQTTTTSTAVPYSFEYGKFMLTVETFGADGKPLVRRRFQQNGIYRTMYGVLLGGRGHHPAKALIEDAVKWIHTGGLDDPLQGVR
ncbi:MAG: hypothetical protein WA182_20915 [Candidatus Sulfotelmatobacter sp.]